MGSAEPLISIELPGITKVRSGKVREVFDLGPHYLLVATDRISAFDCIMPNGIPCKGEVLTRLAAWWFNKLEHIIPNHLVSTDINDFPSELRPYDELLENRSMLVKKTNVIPVECVARGYLIGSGWKEYKDSGMVCGIPLRPGYRLADRLDEPIFTPATKAEHGHDENISFSEMINQVGRDTAIKLRDFTLRLYGEAFIHASKRGIVLADTKFEFGIDSNGQIILIDEALTPDSSRYWPRASYIPGDSPPSFDKQYVRDYLDQLDWDKKPPAPALPPEVVSRTRDKYLEALHLLTGEKIAG
ncbi:MAG TPA: phosphoribosylaminoimidazolesuccinocarboxamide synthase [Kiritimatiellia bacterium]|nr:phosphoribosylaminoimidazolesuccinocarboxamide synthase [Kiritimatiellia bacterium]